MNAVMDPCPFCGHSFMEIDYCEEGCCGAKPRSIQCPCGCELSGHWRDDNESIAAWNERIAIWPIMDIMQRLLTDGHCVKEQDGRWWLFRSDGEGIISGENYRGLCVNIVMADL